VREEGGGEKESLKKKKEDFDTPWSLEDFGRG